MDTLEHTIGIRDGLISLPCKDKVPENILHIPPLKDIHILLTSFGRDGVSNRILKDNPKLHFGAAVSGGSDSMFLIQYLHLFLSKRHSHLMDHLNYIPSLTAFVVDHKIRSESTKEANTVKKILNESGINCNILSLHWSHDDEHTKSKQAILRNKVIIILLDVIFFILLTCMYQLIRDIIYFWKNQGNWEFIIYLQDIIGMTKWKLF